MKIEEKICIGIAFIIMLACVVFLWLMWLKSSQFNLRPDTMLVYAIVGTAMAVAILVFIIVLDVISIRRQK